MSERAELLKLQSDILAGIDAAKAMLRRIPAGSDERERTLEQLSELRKALVRSEKSLDETDDTNAQ